MKSEPEVISAITPAAEALGRIAFAAASAAECEPEDYTKLVLRQITFLAFQEKKRLVEGKPAPAGSPLIPEYYAVHLPVGVRPMSFSLPPVSTEADSILTGDVTPRTCLQTEENRTIVCGVS